MFKTALHVGEKVPDQTSFARQEDYFHEELHKQMHKKVLLLNFGHSAGRLEEPGY